MQHYQDQLYQAKHIKAENARNKVRVSSSSYPFRGVYLKRLG
jgi:hypothetical protein